MEEKSFQLMEQFRYLQWLMARHMRQSCHRNGALGTPFGGQGRVLMLLKLKPETTQKELLEILGMRSQSLGELLGKLEKSGYITRSQSETDRRVTVIRLTEKGAAVDDPRKKCEEETDIFTCLSPEEQDQFGGYLGRIIENLKEMTGTVNETDMGGDPFFGRGRRHGGSPESRPPFDRRRRF